MCVAYSALSLPPLYTTEKSGEAARHHTLSVCTFSVCRDSIKH
jgi:hypothetical protein